MQAWDTLVYVLMSDLPAKELIASKMKSALPKVGPHMRIPSWILPQSPLHVRVYCTRLSLKVRPDTVTRSLASRTLANRSLTL